MKTIEIKNYILLSVISTIVLLASCHKKDTILPGGNGNSNNNALKANFKFKLDSTDNTNRTVIFTDSSHNAVSWFWIFGDDSTSIQQNPTHVYSGVTPGTIKKFAVKLVVTNTAGTKDSIVDSIAVGKHIIPTASNISASNFSYRFITNGFTDVGTDVTFSATTTGATTYDWDFGDNSTHGTAASPTHTYTKSGTYTAILKVTSISGDQVQTTTATPIIVNVYDGIAIKKLNVVAKGIYTDTSKYIFTIIDTANRNTLAIANILVDSYMGSKTSWNFDASNSSGFATNPGNGVSLSNKANGNAVGIASTGGTSTFYLTSSPDLWNLAITTDPDNIDNLINLTHPITSNDMNAPPRAGYLQIDVPMTNLTTQLFIQLHKVN